MIRTNVLGMPRIGKNRELKRACESFWAGKITEQELIEAGKQIRCENWTLQKEAGCDLIPSNDFSFYDQVLDMTVMMGAIPQRYESLKADLMKLYFAMARGLQQGGDDVIAMEMTKWFDTNYHYIVPEFTLNQKFSLFGGKAVDEYREAKQLGVETKPVILGPVSFLLMGKCREDNGARLGLLAALLPAYTELLKKLQKEGCKTVQIDEPFLAMDIDTNTRNAYKTAFAEISKVKIDVILTTYFAPLADNTELAVSLPTAALHIDLVRNPEQLESVMKVLPKDKKLSLGVVDGRNIWKNDFANSLEVINKAVSVLGEDRVLIGGSCSFLHVPHDLDLETDTKVLPMAVKRWMAFAKQKLTELTVLKNLANGNEERKYTEALDANMEDIGNRRESPLIHNPAVKTRINGIRPEDSKRKSPFGQRQKLQQEQLNLPQYPTTTIGSFPQTKDVRSWRQKFKKGELNAAEYERLLREETEKCIRTQEELGLDVLVHGEFERNDMVEYFGEHLDGFTFTQNGWVQSYGSRGVKPPVIYGDVSRPHPMTVEWSRYAQSLTNRPMKGMLTGPVTILEWSFVRDDQPRSNTCKQIALAIRDEVADLEKAGIKVIQIDEPAIREGLPLRRNEWNDYLDWAVESFRLSSSVVDDKTQIHTHMCYSEFNDIIESIANMDADAITIECSRSQMELLNIFSTFKYPNGIGPGVYDIHSPRVPSKEEMVALLKKASTLIEPDLLWVNPDCGLKTRQWPETLESLKNMIAAAREMRG